MNKSSLIFQKLPSFIEVDGTISMRRVLPEDEEGYAQIVLNDPDIKKYLIWPSRVKEKKDIIPEIQKLSDKDMNGKYTILENEKVIGYMAVFLGGEKYLGLGYFLGEKARGKGYMRKAVGVFIETLKTHLQPECIFIEAAHDNHASKNIALHYGFVPEEVFWQDELNLEERVYRLYLS